MSVSSKNSTSTPLNDGQTWTGQTEDCSVWSSLNLSLKADQDSELTLQFSSDGSNWDITVLNAFPVPSEMEYANSFKVLTKYFRCSISNNSGNNQTYLRFQSILQKSESVVNISSMPPVDVVIDKDNDSVLVYGFDGTNNQKLSTNVNGHLKSEITNTPTVSLSSNVVSLNNESVNVRALANATDSMLVYGTDGGANRAILTDGTGKILSVVSASDLDIRALNSTDDAVMCSAYDGTTIRQVKCNTSGQLDTLSSCTQSGSWAVSVNDVASNYRNLDCQTTSSQVGSGSKKLHSLLIHNDSASTKYVKLYNSSSADNTNTPIMTVPVLAESMLSQEFPVPVNFGTALCVRGTANLADNDNTSPSVNDLVLNLTYS